MRSLDRVCSRLTGGLLCAMVVFSPWALGSTPRWAVWSMNVGGYALGVLLLVQRLGHVRSAPPVPCWNRDEPRWMARALGAVTIFLLGWTLVSALNAKSAFIPGEDRLQDYPHYLAWLPHSYDGPSTWFAFWTYLGLAGLFWGARAWLTAVTDDERRCWEEDRHEPYLPRNLRTLFWVLSINGGVLALVSIAQRLEGTPKRLWLFDGPGAEAQFGPFDYRGNAAQYFNLIWPLTLGFWWTLASQKGAGRFGQSPRTLLPFLVVLMVVCPLIAGTRGGAVIALAELVGAGLVFLIASRRHAPRLGWGAVGVCVVAAAAGVSLGWDRLGARFFAPDVVEPLKLDRPLEEFTLTLRLRLPPEPVPQWTDLASLLDQRRRSNLRPDGFFVFVSSKGALVVRQNSQVHSNYLMRILPGFLERFAGKEVEVTVCRHTNLVVHANGQALESSNPRRAQTEKWGRSLSPSFLLCSNLTPARREQTCRLLSVRLERRGVAHVVGGPREAPAGGAGGGRDAEGPESLAHLDLENRPVQRLSFLHAEDWSGRAGLYEEAAEMAKSLPRWWGSGPGSFSGLFRIHTTATGGRYQPHLHNDWSEIRITFGWIAATGLWLFLALLAGRPWGARDRAVEGAMIGVFWIALIGCLLHARFDYPFQVHSVGATFIMAAAVLTTLGLKRR